MAGILKTSKREYEFTLDNMVQLIAADLNVRPEQVTVDYVIGDTGPGDPMDRYPAPRGVVGVRVWVDDTPKERSWSSSLGSQIEAVESDRRPFGDK